MYPVPPPSLPPSSITPATSMLRLFLQFALAAVASAELNCKPSKKETEILRL